MVCMRLDVSKRNRDVLIAALMVVVTIFALLQYRWFSSIAERETEAVYESMTLSVNKIAVREQQRYAILYDWMYQMQGIGIASDLQALQLAGSLLDRFGPQGEVPDLIASVDVIAAGSADPAWELVGSWGTDGLEVTGREIPDAMSELLEEVRHAEDPRQVYSGGDPGTRLIVLPLKPEGRIWYMVLSVDTAAFTQTYVLPAIYEELGEYRLQWEISSEDPRFERFFADGTLNGYSYRFDPFSSLIGRTFVATHTFSVPLLVQGELTPPWLDQGGSAGPDRRRELRLSSASITASPADQVGWILGLQVAGSNYAARVERTFSWVLTGGITLMLLIGLVCIGLLNALYRARQQRQREQEFTASITHELRTPLTVIQSAADNLSLNLIAPERVGLYSELIKRQTRDLGNIIENILVFSRLEGKGGYQVQEQPTVFAQLFHSLDQELQVIAAERGITLIWDMGGIPEQGLCDQTLLSLSLKNLITNALYHAYGPEGGEVRMTARYLHSHAIALSIADDGVGIPQQEQKTLFKPYYRGEHTRSTQVKGSGLGLFIAQRNLQILGGTLVLESPYERVNGQLLRGCCFTITVPWKEVGDAEGTDHRG